MFWKSGNLIRNPEIQKSFRNLKSRTPKMGVADPSNYPSSGDLWIERERERERERET